MLAQSGRSAATLLTEFQVLTSVDLQFGYHCFSLSKPEMFTFFRRNPRPGSDCPVDQMVDIMTIPWCRHEGSPQSLVERGSVWFLKINEEPTISKSSILRRSETRCTIPHWLSESFPPRHSAAMTSGEIGITKIGEIRSWFNNHEESFALGNDYSYCM